MRCRAVADPAGGRASVRKPRPAIFPQPPTPPAGWFICDVRYSYVLADFPILAAQEIREVVDLKRERTAALTGWKEEQQFCVLFVFFNVQAVGKKRRQALVSVQLSAAIIWHRRD